MFTYWQRLTQTVDETLETERIGVPVFVKCTIVLTAEAADLKQTAASHHPTDQPLA